VSDDDPKRKSGWPEGSRHSRGQWLIGGIVAGLVLLSALAGLLSPEYMSGLLGDWEGSTPSATNLVKSSTGDGNTDLSGALGSIDSGARQIEASRLSKSQLADSGARASAAAAAKALVNPPVEGSERPQIERLIQLLDKSEATWAEGYNAERERADGIARDLASVRAELADRVAAETAARAEVARMAKLLEAKETDRAKKLAAEQDKSERLAKDAARVRAELPDGAAGEIPAQAPKEATTAVTTGSAMTDRRKTVPALVRPTMDRDGGSTFAPIFGFGSKPRASKQVSISSGLLRRERHGSRSVRTRPPVQNRPMFARTRSFGFF
jgi:hypothetical protein